MESAVENPHVRRIVAVDFAAEEVDLGTHGDESGPFQVVNGKKSGGPGDGKRVSSELRLGGPKTVNQSRGPSKTKSTRR